MNKRKKSTLVLVAACFAFVLCLAFCGNAALAETDGTYTFSQTKTEYGNTTQFSRQYEYDEAMQRVLTIKTGIAVPDGRYAYAVAQNSLLTAIAGGMVASASSLTELPKTLSVSLKYAVDNISVRDLQADFDRSETDGTYKTRTYEGNETAFDFNEWTTNKRGIELKDIQKNYALTVTLTVETTLYDEKANQYFWFTYSVPVSSVTLAPVADGEQASATAEFYSDNIENRSSSLNVTFSLNSDVFGGDYGYDAEIIDGMPFGGEWFFVLNESAELVATQPNLQIDEFPAEEYYLRGKYVFNDKGGNRIELSTNKVLVKNHSLEIKTNGIYTTNVPVGEEVTYQVLLDRGATAVAEERIRWITGVDNMQTDIPSQEFTETEETSAKYTFDQVGVKRVRIVYEARLNAYQTVRIFKDILINVSENPTRIAPVYTITFNYPKDGVLLVGGKEVVVTATINQVFGDEKFVCFFDVFGGTANITEQTDKSVSLLPVAEGKATILCKFVSATAGTFAESLVLNVIQSTEKNTSFVANEFNKTGSDAAVKLSIGGYTEFLNYTPTWTAKLEEHDDYTVPIKTLSDGSFTLLSAKKGHYKINVAEEFVKANELRLKVSDVDFAELVKTLLPVFAAIMTAGIVVAILVKRTISIKRTVKNGLIALEEKMSKLALSSSLTTKKFAKELRHADLSVRYCLAIAEEVDSQSLGQHRILCETLATATKIISASLKNVKKLDSAQMTRIADTLSVKYIQPAIQLSIEMEESLAKFNGQKTADAVVRDPDAKQPRKPTENEILNEYCGIDKK